MSTPVPESGAPAERRAAPMRESAGPITFTRLKWTSFGHSCIYLGLLLTAFALGKPEPATFILGMSHGLLWIFMSLVCITAARLRVISLRTGVSVAVLGGIGPFFGSYEFIREERSRGDDSTTGQSG